jgi:small subunit ribosomal protein S5
MSKHILRDTLAVRRPVEVSANNLKDQVVSIQRVTKVVKGGKNLSFSALVVVGDRARTCRFRHGQGPRSPHGHPQGHRAGQEESDPPEREGHLHSASGVGRYGSGQVLLKPASEGTGIIAGGPVRAVMEVAGIQQRADQIHRHVEPAQRHQGHL